MITQFEERKHLRMPSFKKRYDAKKKKEALGLLKAFADKIKNGEVEVETVGWWEAVRGKYNLKLTVKDHDFSEDSQDFS